MNGQRRAQTCLTLCGVPCAADLQARSRQLNSVGQNGGNQLLSVVTKKYNNDLCLVIPGLSLLRTRGDGFDHGCHCSDAMTLFDRGDQAAGKFFALGLFALTKIASVRQERSKLTRRLCAQVLKAIAHLDQLCSTSFVILFTCLLILSSLSLTALRDGFLPLPMDRFSQKYKTLIVHPCMGSLASVA